MKSILLTVFLFAGIAALSCASSTTGGTGGGAGGGSAGGAGGGAAGGAGGGTAGGAGGGSAASDGGADFGAACDAGTQCNSGVCFSGTIMSFCSLRCDAGSQCPNPPTTGMCNNQGYCK
jgi:hypothetical protein